VPCDVVGRLSGAGCLRNHSCWVKGQRRLVATKAARMAGLTRGARPRRRRCSSKPSARASASQSFAKRLIWFPPPTVQSATSAIKRAAGLRRSAVQPSGSALRAELSDVDRQPDGGFRRGRQRQLVRARRSRETTWVAEQWPPRLKKLSVKPTCRPQGAAPSGKQLLDRRTRRPTATAGLV
jgi:hypothetical protein